MDSWKGVTYGLWEGYVHNHFTVDMPIGPGF